MRIFVTGGAGFLGSAFIRWVLSNTTDVSVVNFDLLTYAGNLENLSSVESDLRYSFVLGDIRDPSAVRAAMAQCDHIVHFAAESHVDRSIEGSAEFLSTNIGGTGVILDVARDLNVQRLLHISTDEVYGSTASGSFSEGDPLEPNSPYSASKAGAELLARSYRETYGLPILITRSTNGFGPFQYPEKFIALGITNLVDGSAIPIYGDGSNVRDWLYAEDNAAAQWTVLTEGTVGEAYNVGAGNELANLEVATRLVSSFGVDDGALEFVEDRPGHDLRYSVDVRRITELGWRPTRSFDDALSEAVAWYQANEAWWRPLKSLGASERRGLESTPRDAQ